MKKLTAVIMTFAIVIGMLNYRNVSIKGEDYFSLMQYRWRDNLVGNLEDKGNLKENAYIVEYTKNLDEDAALLYESMNLDEGRVSLWTRNSNEQKSSYLTRNFNHLSTLAKAYGTVGTQFYDDEEMLTVILEGLAFLVDVEGYNGKGYYGNWWDWQIGIPGPFLAMLSILGDEIPTEDRDRYLNVLELYLPDPYKQIYSNVGGEVFKPIVYTGNPTTGANRADLAHSVLGIGVLKGDQKIINTAINSVPDVFEIVPNGEGFHEDGMFLFHKDTPYIGSYGVSLFKSVASMLSIVADTPFDMKPDIKDTFIRLVKDSTLPFINKGKFVGMVEGRAISRPSNHTENARGSGIVKMLSMAAQINTDPVSEHLFKSVKYWVSEDPDYYISITSNFEELISIINVISSDINIDGFVPFDGAKVFPTGDRFVYGDTNSYIGLSMYSNRISGYTVGNSENLKGWHLSDGFVYMMNDDKQFGKSYWPTVDMYRLPGTTVDTRTLDPARDDWVSHNSVSKWAGGTNSQRNASVSMFLDKNGYKNNKIDVGMDLQAKKSWFMIDGNLVSMGSDISGTTNQTIEQIIENKLLDTDFNYEFLDHGANVSTGNLNISKGDSFLLKAKDQKNSIGYTFLEDAEIKYELDKRKGTYNAINGGVPADSEEFEETYLKLIKNYGSNVTDGKYAYIQTQNANQDILDQNAERFQILEQSSDIHAVYDKNTGTTGATIWNKTGGKVGNVTSNKGVSLLIEEKALSTDIYISEPTHSGEKITVTVENTPQQEIIVSANVKQINETTFEIDTSKSNGKTASIRFITPVDKIELEELYNEMLNLDTTIVTPYKRFTLKKLTDEAEMLIGNPTASYEDVQDVISRIVDAYNNEDTLINTYPIDLLIQKVNLLDESIFTEKSWSDLTLKMSEMEALRDQYNYFEAQNLDQEDFDNAYRDANNAFNALQLKRDGLNYKQFNAEMAKFEKLNEQDYTVLSYGMLKVEVKQANKDVKSLTLTQDELNTIVQRLSNSYKQLEEK